MIITAVIGGNSGTGSVGADITVPLFIVTFLSVPVALIAKLFVGANAAAVGVLTNCGDTETVVRRLLDAATWDTTFLSTEQSVICDRNCKGSTPKIRTERRLARSTVMRRGHGP
jgi:hypothetical protein